MSDVFTFRPLVSAYYADPRVQSAVDELISSKRFGTGYSAEFEWDEFGAYVDAWLAAQQTAAEWARDLYDFWDAVWGPLIGTGCPLIPRPTSTADLSDGNISDAWVKGWYIRHVRTRLGPVGLVVFGIGEDFSLQIEFETARKKIDLPGWTVDGCEVDSPTVPLARNGGCVTLDLTRLRSYAREAIEQLAIR